jgi:hypothetical protein
MDIERITLINNDQSRFKLKKIILFLVLICTGSIILSGAVSATNITVNPTSGIQNAINTAHNGDTLNLISGTYKEHNIQVNKNLTIAGPKIIGKTPTAIIDAQKLEKVFHINSDTKVNLQYLLIQNGNEKEDSDSAGGGIYNEGNLIIKNCMIQKNTAISFGGGICNYGSLTLTNSNLYNNTVDDGAGGGIGGGIYCGYGTVILTNSNIYNNVATDGGGICGGKNVTLINSNVYDNFAISGGGIKNSYGSMNLINSKIFKNTAYYYGGGIYNGGNMNINASNIYQNLVRSQYGGGIYNQNKMIMTSSSLYNNYAPYGGGIYNDKYGNAKIIFCRIIGNTAISYRAIYNNGGIVNAAFNWWGSSFGPSKGMLYGIVTVKPWLTIPKITSTSPTNLKTGVSKTSTIIVKFNENIKNSTYNNNIKVKNLTTGKYVTITKSISGNTLNIKTSTTRSKYTWYQIIMPKAAIKDYAGDNLQATYTFKFKTGP